MENPPFWWYLPGKMVIFMGYVSFREGNWIGKLIAYGVCGGREGWCWLASSLGRGEPKLSNHYHEGISIKNNLNHLPVDQPTVWEHIEFWFLININLWLSICFSVVTLPDTNIAPENWWLEHYTWSDGTLTSLSMLVRFRRGDTFVLISRWILQKVTPPSKLTASTPLKKL